MFSGVFFGGWVVVVTWEGLVGSLVHWFIDLIGNTGCWVHDVDIVWIIAVFLI